MNEVKNEMQLLVNRLNEASDIYYNTSSEIMSNMEYDGMFDRLRKMEEETGITLPDSPTIRTGYKVVDNLPKVTHEFPALSLDKTKDINEFPEIFKGESIVMWKMDGSTVQLTYEKGKLVTAATRGNGEVGSDITHNAAYIKGIPKKIPYTGKLVVRGEAVMSYFEFDRINESIPEKEQYKNPRNLANASIQMLDSREMAKREIIYHAFRMVYKETDKPQKMADQFTELEEYGFNVVEYGYCKDPEMLMDMMEQFSNRVSSFEYPVDGLVVADDRIEYADTLPGTGHHPNKQAGYAFKWADEEAKTKLIDIEWSPSRTGLINPVAIFEPVELEGTTVSRASLHNVSEMERLLGSTPYKSETVFVYKANKIIPAISRSERCEPIAKDDLLSVPDLCPSCKMSTDLVKNRSNGSNIVATLWCKNPHCPAKNVGRFVHFAERDCEIVKNG